MPTDQQISEFLSYLEDEEAKLLAWGYVDGGFTSEELMDLAISWTSKLPEYMDPHELIDSLTSKQALDEYAMPTGEIWRTRMGESVRLFARLRQIFDAKDWPKAPTLISDFRFMTRRRRYPARNISVPEVLSSVNEIADINQIGALQALLTREKPMQLSRFQVNATVHMFRALQKRESRGMIVCAGTGTGKTLSFYLPALSSISTWIEKGEYWTKAIALYPRNELLKDQFLETYQEVRRLDRSLLDAKKRKVRIGAIYGSVPKNVSDSKALSKVSWTEQPGIGYICPFIKCPNADCHSPMVWKNNDIRVAKERLHCTSCQTIIDEDEVILTRDRMKREPPDVLFTSTEMMNRLMSDLSSRELLGIGAMRAPRLVLLDEVHTYDGIHGAQVAYLLRRFQHAIGEAIHFTGLSATLEDASAFFAQLTAIPQHFIEEIGVGDDMVEEGKEYQLILRGDPSSGTALLSATIQAAMLIRRILDVDSKHPSGGMFGTKAFLFTDDLDITNRLYDNLRDAEGLNGWNKRKKDPLAATRRHNLIPDNVRAFQHGQSWKITENIGHNLRNAIPLGRTSSQDSGVASEAQLVVATASLEVGFNDPEVGAVIQHKAPLDLASFLQRKGRAGRRRGMRPWTVTVLSDFGRDRIMYQNFEILFDPILSNKSLPLHNRYVLRMQAVYTFMDWAAEELRKRRSFTFGELWHDFAIPDKEERSRRERQLIMADIIDDVLTKPSFRRKLEIYLQEALAISAEEMTVLLWDPPRSLLASVLPTLYRRLKTNWRRYANSMDMHERFTFNHPLPEFIPSSLFSDLTLPEISFEFADEKEVQEVPDMPILQALNVFTPGKVSRRFGNKRMQQSHWIATPSLEDSATPYPLDIQTFCTEYEEMGTVSYREADGTIMELPFLRPWTLRVSNTPSHIGTSSNASQIWNSRLSGSTLQDGRTQAAKVPSGTVWQRWIDNVRFYTHSQQTAVLVKRFTTGADAVVRHHKTEKSNISMRYVRDNKQVGLGFMLESDGVHFRINLPTNEDLFLTDEFQDKIQSFRSLYYQFRIAQDERLKGIANIFQIDRLSETYLSALSATAIKSHCNIEEAFQLLQRSSLRSVCEKVLSVIFMTKQQDDSPDDLDDSDAGDDNDDDQYQRSHAELLMLCEIEEVANVIYDHVPRLWLPLDDHSYEWAQRRWATTLGAAILHACKEISNQSTRNDLLLDVVFEPQESNHAEIWITESTSGGGGIVEDIMQKYQMDPRRFYRLVESALGPSDIELIDAELSRTLSIYKQDSTLREHFRDVRELNGISSAVETLPTLQRYLRERGVLVTHSVMNSLYNRILKPGSSELTDTFIDDIVTLWKTEEARLGIYMDVRVFAYVFSSNDEIVQRFKKALNHIDAMALQDANWRFHVIAGMLWPRGNQVRTRALIAYNPFVKYPPTDRELVLHGLIGTESVYLSDKDWWSKATTRLQHTGNVRLVAEPAAGAELQKALLRLASEPIEVGFLHVFPRVEGLSRDTNIYTATIDIREV